jgi:tetratricopeptide (TPR) repeat protein
MPSRKTFISRIFKSDKKQKHIEGVTHKQITGRRLWLFRVIALTVIPALLFLLLEITLRVVGYGFPTDTTIKFKIGDTDSCCSNVKFSWRFFPPAIARATDPFTFPADKSDDTYRIFIMGASAAAGTPDGAFSFGRILQVMLRQRYPKANFEIVTTAMPAINSHVVLEVAKDCARHQADLFVVYLGNNEVVGPYGAGTVFTSLSSNLSLIRFGIVLKATKLGQLMTNLFEAAGAGDVPKVWRGMQMFLEKQVRVDDPGLKAVYRHFQSNLEDIESIARKNETKIIFCTVGGNLKDSPPFASLHRPDLKETEQKRWDDIYKRGTELESSGNYAEATQRYLKAAEIDDQYADLQFRLGRCYWLMGQYDEARARYIRARELDTLRFRAGTRINEIIREAAGNKAANGVYLVDAVSVFEKSSSYEIPGEELFYEHVHLNFKGNYLLAEAIFKQVEKILLERIKRHGAGEQSIPTEAECAEYLAYTDWDKHRIAEKVLNEFIRQPPFTNQLYHDQRVEQMEQEIKALKDAISPKVTGEIESQYRRAIEQTPSDWWLHWKYGLLLEDLEKYGDAARQNRSVIDYMPYHYEAYAKLGFLSGRQGDLDAAIACNLEAVRIYPSYAEAYYNLGFACQLQRKLDKAVEYYYKAIRFMPDNTPAYNNLGLVLYQQGKVTEALDMYRSGLKAMPENLNLHYNFGILLEKQGHRDEAIKELRAALQIDPNSAKVRKKLSEILKEQN